MVESRPIRIGLGVSMPEDSLEHSCVTDDITHPINNKYNFSLAKRSLGDTEQLALGANRALVPQYAERESFPFRNSSSIPDMSSSFYSRGTQAFDFSAEEHASMRMDPHENNAQEAPGLSADSGSMTMSESSEAVLSPLPHPLGSKLNLWHEVNKSSSAGAARGPPEAMRDPHPSSADDTINTVQLNYSKKQYRHPSLIRTPNTVCTADWAEAFNQRYEWVRGENEPQEGLLQPGLPTLPAFPRKALIVDEKPCDHWGRPQCTSATATMTIALCTLFPPLWLLVGAGYFDGLVGVIPRGGKLAAFGLGLATLCAALILALCLALL